MEKNKLVLSFLIFISVILLFTSIYAFPKEPHQLYGSVKVNNESVPDGTAVYVQIEGDTYTVLTKNDDFGLSPDLLIIDDFDGNRQGETMNILLNFKPVRTLTFVNNGYTKLDLSTETTCGDSYCLGSENQNTCSADCGVPAGNPAAGSGGGGGGGGGGAITTVFSAGNGTCAELWECTVWDDCVDGEQKRTCADLSQCGTSRVKPIEARKCVIESNNQNAVNPDETSSFLERFWSSITGRAIDGENGSISFWSILIILAVISALALILRFRRK